MASTIVSETIAGLPKQLAPTDDQWSTTVEQCKLPKTVREIALKELREDENTREQCLLAFRQWILKNPDIQNVDIESTFLLRFLRTKKFSLPMAQQLLLKYLNLRQKYPMYFTNLDCLNPAVNDLIDAGYMFVSPFRDNHGRRVIIGSAKGFDLQKFTSKDLGLTHMVTYETLLNDEVNQVMGFTHIGDLASISPAYITLFTPNEFATLIKWGEVTFTYITCLLL
uniref:Clavesin-2 n=1 Tax=Sipha flava TaxID=143950 RepID=A0A2S2QH58_9HEMI